jgi:hypothetical protein
MNLKRSVLFVVVAAVGGCAEQSYVYTPDTPNAVTAGLPAARIAIPPERPQGQVEVASYGITELHPSGATVPALHVRMIVTNDGDDQPWRLDTREQYVAIAGEGRSRAMYVNTNVQTLPVVAIPRHARRVLDFYFPLPDTIQSDARLPRCQLQWQVDTAAREVASSTAFDRVEPEPVDTYAYGTAWPYWAGYGPYWWYDPLYPTAVFVHARPIAIRDRRGPVGIGRFGGHFHARGGHVARGGRGRR